MMRSDLSGLTPHEYLEELQRKAFGGDPPPYAADVGDVMTATLLGSLPTAHQRALADVAIGVLPNGDANAYVMKVPGGGEIIGFNFGLMSFLLALNKLLMSRAGVFSFEPLLSLEEVRHEAQELANAFSANAALKRRLIAPRRMMFAAALSSAQSAFVVGHELGHLLLRHFHLVENVGFDHTLTIDACHKMEFEADARGAEMVIGSFRQTRDPFFGTGAHAATLAGPDIFFTFHAFAFGSTKDSTTHPSALTRREELRRRFWGDLPTEAKELANFAEKVFVP